LGDSTDPPAKKGRFVFDHSPDAADCGMGSDLDCTLVAVQSLAISTAESGSLRGRVSGQFGTTLSVGVIKQLEDQQAMALLTLKQAIDSAGLTPEELDRWGLVACSRTPGRKRIGDSLVKFRDAGAWSMSPHIIPYCSLHSLPGLLSQGLRLHGPNIGSGGLPGSECEAIWAALALLFGDRLPGVWLVFSGSNQNICQAVALGIQRATLGAVQPGLRFRFGAMGMTALTLETLSTAISQGANATWDLGGATATFRFNDMSLEAAA